MPSALLLLGCILIVPFGHLHALGSVPAFLGGSAVMLLGFYLSIRQKNLTPVLFWVIAVGARILLLWQAPGADIFRYVWEGEVLGSGFNPYLHAPSSLLLEPLRNGGWELVQHKAFSAIYPPLTECVFAWMAWIYASPIFFKIIFVFADGMIVLLLSREFGLRRAQWYAWNPLILVSFAGGGHYDSLFVLALVGGWLAWRRDRRISAACMVGAAVALKWMALPLLAWIVWRALVENGWKKALVCGLIGLLPFCVTLAWIGVWTNEWTLQLLPPKFSQYARSAEFIPAVVGWFWEESLQRNQWFLVPLAVGWATVILRARTFESAAQWLFFVALILTPMLHAWYFCWMIPFLVVTRNLGLLLVTTSSFVYYMLYHHVETPGGQWMLSPWETLLLWLPFVAGFLWSEFRCSGFRTGEDE